METMNNQPVQPAETLPPVGPPQSKGLAIASMVLGIAAVLTGLIYLGALLGILAIIFGIVALKKKVGKGMAIAGIVTGALGIVGSIVSLTLVMLAVPALQQSARDTDRKNQVGLIMSEIQNYQANNQGALPDPAMVSETLKTGKLDISASGEPTTDTAVYAIGAYCDGSVNEGAYTVTVKLESGEKYCVNS